jgi:uncharacterized protein (DUF2126 family)/transglutaminase-like putative cysteine protease
MSTRIALLHHIERRYSRRAVLPTHWLRLRPAPHTPSEIQAYSLNIQTRPHFLNWVRDPFENHLARLDLPEPVLDLTLEVELIADLKSINPFDFLVEPLAVTHPFAYPEQLQKELKPYLHVGRIGPRLADWLGVLDQSRGYILEKLNAINTAVYRHWSVTSRVTDGMPNPPKTDHSMTEYLEMALTRDHASHWEAACLLTLSLRSLGLAARFTSGYRIFLAPAGSPPGNDLASLHAWSEVFLPGAGWIGLDPAAGIFTHQGYLPLASTPDMLRALPVVSQEQTEFDQHHETIRVRRLLPSPKPSPYSDTQWADIGAVGHSVDTLLERADLRLANSTSLCFVADTPERASEWATTSLGTNKRASAEELLNRLRVRFAPGGIIHESQGEWFAGEMLPRWRLNVFFRADGRPIWQSPTLLGPLVKGAGLNAKDAEYFAQILLNKLGIPGHYLLPAHEDPLHELWLKRSQTQFQPPAEVLSSPTKRQELAIHLSETRCEPVGYVLPLRWDPVSEKWTSGAWSFRRAALYLIPGGSSLGFRLPLDSLPIGDDAPTELTSERCQFEERPLLPEIHGELSARLTTVMKTPAIEQADSDRPGKGAPRTALCLQIRQGRLYVFMPPLTHLEHYLDLLTTLEATAFGTGIPINLEGYEPPEDHRLLRLTLEPEAGVLRVTLPLSNNWNQSVEWLTTTYREAEKTGLRALRIAENGRVLPPGGSADLVLGGEQPACSPFLLRPQLLHSVIAYWQRHPSLSYFFSGRMIGPSGTAPRPDEGRADALYELDIALARMPKETSPLPWLPDRILRHLLTDPAGDMRHAEIRVDRLYEPNRPSQRLGQIMLRSFETAPDHRLAAAQLLLVRGLLAYLVERPVKDRLIDWGTSLHDRFMLPRLLWEDLSEVLRDLNEIDIPIQTEWFRPFLDLRFPLLGRVQLGDIGLELRPAQEPWPLLSEEATSAGMTRFIDPANDRVQVEVFGATPNRHVLVCNGRRVSLQSTGTKGQYVAGVRYKAWNPVATLHPTIPPVYSLVFDLIDAWSNTVLGGFTYFPPHPDAWHSLGTPIHPPETDSSGDQRHLRPQPITPPPWNQGGRFIKTGSGNQKLDPPPVSLNPRYPYLLDLTFSGIS